jgi:hypothetical protein
MEDNQTLTDINKYKKYLDNFNLTDDHKTDIVMIISSICSHFIDDAFNGPSDKTIGGRYNELKKNLPQTPERIRTKKNRKIKEIDGQI